MSLSSWFDAARLNYYLEPETLYFALFSSLDLDPMADILNHLRQLEVSLHQPEVRSDRGRLAALLHPEFREIGRSGNIWFREAILSGLDGHGQQYRIWSQDFEIEQLSQGIALLNYKSAYLTHKGHLERHTIRASIWIIDEHGWRMRFHQGTPSAPFELRVI